MDTMTTEVAFHGTVRYLAYELVMYERLPSTASDVHALGCVGREVRASPTNILPNHNATSASIRNIPTQTSKMIKFMQAIRYIERLRMGSHLL
jgi:hypothetical protein